MKTQVVVISMPDAGERQARFTRRAEGSPVAWSFFPALSELHPQLTYQPQDALATKGRPLTRGEIGCYSSHYAAWIEFSRSDADQLLVLEDDTIVDWTIVALLCATDAASAGIHYLRLFYKFPTATRIVRRDFLDRGRKIVELSQLVHGTQGYLLTRSGAERFLAHCRRMRRPIDNELDRSWAHGVPNLSLFPFALVEEAAGSGIGTSRFEPHRTPFSVKLARRRELLAEKLRRGAQAVTGYGRFKGGRA